MIELQKISKDYVMGTQTVSALRGIDLSIEAGDFVAIMGPSGSGKSTLTNILGLLDVPTEGSYRLNGKEVSQLSDDDLAVVRREEFGFIFQQFNLLPRMTALENVALPLIYSKHQDVSQRSVELLKRVGLESRLLHKPSELSGGQQQRVVIARALANNPKVIFADEPTGNLDSVNAKEIMIILHELNARGITIILVTHEEDLASQAKRLIKMRDGEIQSDVRIQSKSDPIQIKMQTSVEKRFAFLRDMVIHFKQGFHALAANKVRTALSTLGISIGVAAVVAMLALGQGAQLAIESQLAGLGSNLLILRPGAIRLGGVAQESGVTTRLTLEDANQISEKISNVKAVAASVNGRGQVTHLNQNWNTQILGTMPSYAAMRSATPIVGRFFTEDENRLRARVAVIGMTVYRQLFTDNPIGAMIKINKVNFSVIGILPEKGATGWRDQDDLIIVPLYTAMYRLLGKNYVDSIDIEMSTAEDLESTQKNILSWILLRHRVALSQQQNAFEVRNMADIQAAVLQSSQTMSLLLAIIAAISLLVGGIGIMNIMLVSVTERTKEIGLRKALGAKRKDILLQFLAESVVVSLVGGMVGIMIAWIIIFAMTVFAGWTTAISPMAILLSCLFSGGIGIIFGLYPAKKAATLAPIDALRYE